MAPFRPSAELAAATTAAPRARAHMHASNIDPRNVRLVAKHARQNRNIRRNREISATAVRCTEVARMKPELQSRFWDKPLKLRCSLFPNRGCGPKRVNGLLGYHCREQHKNMMKTALTANTGAIYTVSNTARICNDDSQPQELWCVVALLAAFSLRR